MNEKPIALVTGAAQGIGFACAQALAADGARIVLVDINESGVQTAAENLGDDAVPITCDMGNAEQVNAMFDRVESEVGVANILINNAGIALPADFLETTLEQFQKVINVNLIQLHNQYVQVNCSSIIGSTMFMYKYLYVYWILCPSNSNTYFCLNE